MLTIDWSRECCAVDRSLQTQVETTVFPLAKLLWYGDTPCQQYWSMESLCQNDQQTTAWTQRRRFVFDISCRELLQPMFPGTHSAAKLQEHGSFRDNSCAELKVHIARGRYVDVCVVPQMTLFGPYLFIHATRTSEWHLRREYWPSLPYFRYSVQLLPHGRFGESLCTYIGMIWTT